MTNILILGATSAIASACARRWTEKGDARFYLAGRDQARLDAVAADLKVRGAKDAFTGLIDTTNPDAQDRLVANAFDTLGPIDIVLVAYGSLPDQAQCQSSTAETLAQVNANATSVVGYLTPIANRLEAQGKGRLAVITSVAGDRGRPSNYVYGAAKAMLQAFCDGLRPRLAKAGVTVTDIRPGFVDTPMTAGLPLPGPLVAKPDAVAAAIVKAVAKGRPVLYAPFFWRPIMFAIRNVPHAIFNRLSL